MQYPEHRSPPVTTWLFPQPRNVLQKAAVCTAFGRVSVKGVLRYLHMVGKSSRGNCHQITSAHHFSPAILQHLCDTHRSCCSGQTKLHLVLRQFSIERERRRADNALTFSSPVALWESTGDVNSSASTA